MRRVWFPVLALLGQAAALTVSGTAPPWTSGATFRQASPGAALADLVAGRSDAALTSLPAGPTPAGAGRLLSIPVGVYAVTVAYNLPGVNLRLDLPALCGLLGGDLRTWNDLLLARLNPGSALPALPVLPSSLTNPNAASLSVARACVGAGLWPQDRLKSTWSAGAVYLRPTLDFLQNDLTRPGALAVFAPGTLPRGVQVATLRTVGGPFAPPTPMLGLTPPVEMQTGSLPIGPSAPLPPADQPGAYPLRGLVWAVVFQDQAYQGRSVQDARDLLAWLERLRASSDQNFAAIPLVFRQPIHLYYNGTPLREASGP